jgi:hypothetical protein
MRRLILILLNCLAVAAAGCQSDQTRLPKTKLPSPWQTVHKTTVTAEAGVFTAR